MAAVMKLLAVAGLLPRILARLQVSVRSISRHSQTPLALSAMGAPSGVHYGDSRCPCIGFDNIEGETMLQFEFKGERKEATYPADMGARCEAWDDDRHFQCKANASPGSGKGWCAQRWCYVDPCKCGIDVLPKIASLYNQEATFQGKPLFWSYSTCGGKDEFTEKVPQVGSPKCRCIGFAGLSGTTEVTLEDGKMVEFAADLGASCQAWDLGVHPECKGDKAPAWCKSNWCYVDPCECDLPGNTLASVPKISAYLPEATFTGKSLYYSYETCGSADTWTEEHNHVACVNQATKEECGRLPRCSWTGSRCLGFELVHHPLCKGVGEKFVKKLESGSMSQRFPLVGFSVAMFAAAAAALA